MKDWSRKVTFKTHLSAADFFASTLLIAPGKLCATKLIKAENDRNIRFGACGAMFRFGAN